MDIQFLAAIRKLSTTVFLDFDNMIKPTIKNRIKRSISTSKSNVFIRSDFTGSRCQFGSYSQVGRALKELVNEAVLVKVGYGVYVKAKISVLSGNPIPSIHLTEIGLQLMKKLGIEADVGYFRRLNRDGKSTQVPMRDVIAVSKPITRKIKWGKKELIYEKL